MPNTNELSQNICSSLESDPSVNVLRVKDYITTITLLDTISDPIFILSANGQIQYVNQYAYRLFSTDFNSLIGRSFRELIVTDSPNSESSVSGNTVETFFQDLLVKSLFDTETALKFNAIQIPVLLNSNPVYDTKGVLEFIVVTTMDLSRREFQLKESQQNHAESIYYNRMKTVGELGVSIIHQLSQPLLSLNLLLEMAQDQIKACDGNSKTETYLSEMESLIQKISHTVESIRSFAGKSETAQFELIALKPILDGLEQYITYELQENRIDFEIHGDDGDILVFANPLMLEQAFVNLLKNSIESVLEAMGEGVKNPKIDIRLKLIKNKWIEIIIDDNGVGISPEIRDKIFTPFFSTKLNPTNTGVGLTISRGIIMSMGGHIQEVEKQASGARFKIDLPSASGNEYTQLYNLIEIQQLQ